MKRVKEADCAKVNEESAPTAAVSCDVKKEVPAATKSNGIVNLNSANIPTPAAIFGLMVLANLI